jgi:gluconokinase
MSECVMAVDIGTTGVRAVAFDPTGKQLHVEAADYPLHTPRPGWAEQDPQQVYELSTKCLREAAGWAKGEGRHVAALGISAILHSIIAVDADGEALTPSIIWADTRSTAEADAVKRETDAMAIYHRVGGPIHPMYPSIKIRWLRTQQPDVFQKAASFVGIKEYVLRRWTGLNVCDKSVASGTGLYNLREGDWDTEALDIAGIDARRLPPVVETTEPLKVPPERLRELGLPDDCVVVAGGGDGVLQTIGSGCVRPGQMVAMVATSGAVRAVSDEPKTDARGRTWCYYLAEGRWVVGAAINNAGIVYAWLRDQLDVEIEQLNEMAAEVPAGSHGLLFLPYLAGERSPNWNANARGLLFGLSLAHDRRHLARATLEGVGYRMRTIFEPMEEVVGPAKEIRAAGGFIRSPLWLQIVADVLGHEMKVTDSPEASSLGAAQLAMRGAGMVDSFDDLGPMVAAGESVKPNEAHHKVYSRLYALYQRLYEKAGDAFSEIAALQAELTG